MKDIRKYIQEGIDYNCATRMHKPLLLPIARAELCAEFSNTGHMRGVRLPPSGNPPRSQRWRRLRSSAGMVTSRTLTLSQTSVGYAPEDGTTCVRISRPADVYHKYGSNSRSGGRLARPVKRAEVETGADFVKTSTGFFTGGKNEGATYEVIKAMMEGDRQLFCKIKGAGGIRDREKVPQAHRHGH